MRNQITHYESLQSVVILLLYVCLAHMHSVYAGHAMSSGINSDGQCTHNSSSLRFENSIGNLD